MAGCTFDSTARDQTDWRQHDSVRDTARSGIELTQKPDQNNQNASGAAGEALPDALGFAGPHGSTFMNQRAWQRVAGSPGSHNGTSTIVAVR